MGKRDERGTGHEDSSFPYQSLKTKRYIGDFGLLQQ